MRISLNRSLLAMVTALALVLAVVIALATSDVVSFGQGEPGGDPALEPIPTVEFPDSAQSIVFKVAFNSPTDVELIGAEVTNSPPPARIGGPPLISVEVFDGPGGLIEQFNEWHPLWVEHEDDNGQHEMTVENSGEGRFVVEFAPDIGTVRITDIQLDLVLIEIDAHQIVVDYCAINSDDPSCDAVLTAAQLPDTGGTSPTAGPSYLTWVAAAVGVLAAAGAGGLTWLAYQRRRPR